MNQQEPGKILLSLEDRQELEHLARRSSAEQRLVERAKILLKSSMGFSNRTIAKELGVSVKTVAKWKKRFLQRRVADPALPANALLVDSQRIGRPHVFQPIFWIDVLSLATSNPKDSDRPISDWTHRELADEIELREMTESISYSTVGRFLRECDLRPHKVKGWLNRKPDPDFDVHAEKVKEVLVEATSSEQDDSELVISFDEKTGMQAKERIAPDQPMKPGQPKRLEYEYKRHGTLVLFGLLVVNTGLVLGELRDNRTNETTAEVLGEQLDLLLNGAGFNRVTVVLDQLNTHCSLDLIEKVCELCELEWPGDEKLETMPQRRKWLSSESEGKSVVFVFTPKHASWLNPIEVWFGVLSKKLLRRGSFNSTENLEEEVINFLNYYNEKLAHPYKFNSWRRKAA